MRTWGVSAWVMVVASCAGSGSGTTTTTSAVEQCTTQYAPSKGYGYADDLSVPLSPPPGAEPPPPVSSLDEAVSHCVAGGPVPLDIDSGTPLPAGEPGSECDPARVMTRDAALCIARASGLAAGISDLQAGLAFHGEYRRIVWSVLNTTYDRGNGEKGGDAWTIDAISGTVLARRSWGQIP